METTSSELMRVFKSSRKACIAIGLTGNPIYALTINSALFPPLVHDRLIQTHNLPTRIGLSILALKHLAPDGNVDLIDGRVARSNETSTLRLSS